MTTKEKIELGEAPFARGDRITVKEEGIRPWDGIITAVKPSSVSGWRIEARRDDDGGTWSVCVATSDITLSKALRLLQGGES